MGDKSVATVDKENNADTTVKLAHDAAGTMILFVIITKGTSSGSLTNFIRNHYGCNENAPEVGVTLGQGSTRYTRGKPITHTTEAGCKRTEEGEEVSTLGIMKF